MTYLLQILSKFSFRHIESSLAVWAVFFVIVVIVSIGRSRKKKEA